MFEKNIPRVRVSITFFESKFRCLGGGWGGRSKLSKFDSIEDISEDDFDEADDNIAVPIKGRFCIRWDKTWSITSDRTSWSSIFSSLLLT